MIRALLCVALLALVGCVNPKPDPLVESLSEPANYLYVFTLENCYQCELDTATVKRITPRFAAVHYLDLIASPIARQLRIDSAPTYVVTDGDGAVLVFTQDIQAVVEYLDPVPPA